MQAIVVEISTFAYFLDSKAGHSLLGQVLFIAITPSAFCTHHCLATDYCGRLAPNHDLALAESQTRAAHDILPHSIVCILRFQDRSCTETLLHTSSFVYMKSTRIPLLEIMFLLSTSLLEVYYCFLLEHRLRSSSLWQSC